LFEIIPKLIPEINQTHLLLWQATILAPQWITTPVNVRTVHSSNQSSRSRWNVGRTQRQKSFATKCRRNVESRRWNAQQVLSYDDRTPKSCQHFPQPSKNDVIAVSVYLYRNRHFRSRKRGGGSRGRKVKI